MSEFLRTFLKERGIDPDGEVARARGYAPYAAGDVDAVYAAMERIAPGLMENAGGRRNPRWVEKFTRSEGFVIPKYRVFDHRPRLLPIRPQLRPRHPVVEKVWEHDHSANFVDAKGRPIKSELAREQHVSSPNRAEATVIDGELIAEEHSTIRRKHKRHRHAATAKYGIARKEPEAAPYLGLAHFDDSKRLDRNPLSDFSLPGPVYFGIEGTPKNDAMVEWLRKHGRPAKVVNVPSVSTWKAPELALFALRHMRGHPVVIVPDADWIENDEVIYHAENCFLYLRHRCGVEAVIAAPPQKAGLKGVDDFLGAGGSLDKLDVISRDFDRDKLDDFVDKFPAVRRGYPKTLDFDLRLARLLGRTSGSHGKTLRNVEALAPLTSDGGLITEKEAGEIAYGYEIPGDTEYTEKQKHATLQGLERLAGVAFEHTGEFPEWVEAHWEQVGRKKDGSPRWALKKGAPGSRIEFLRVDERLRVHPRKPEPLGEYLERVSRSRA
jgi:hypothetical protein